MGNRNPNEIAIASRVGIDAAELAAQKNSPIFGRALFGGEFPLKWHAPGRDGRVDPRDSVQGWPLHPAAQPQPAQDADPDDEDTDDEIDQAADPAGIATRKGARVIFPSKKKI